MSRSQTRDAAAARLAGTRPEPAVTGVRAGRVVAGVDGSPESEAVVRFAAAEAARRGAELHLVTAWSMPGGHAGHARVPGPLRDGVIEEARSGLSRIAREVLREGPGVPVVLAVAEPPLARALAEASRDADAVVIGPGGRGAAGLLPGTVTSRVTRHARCPVIIVPRDGTPPSRPPHREEDSP